MKIVFRTGAGILLGLLVLGGNGCHKQAAPEDHPTSLQEAENALQTQLATANNAVVKSNFYNGVIFNLRYRFYDKALPFAQAVASDTTLTDPQKKAANDLVNQINQAIASPPPGGPPAAH